VTATKLHGIVDMPADEYHRNPALSSSGARKLLPPSCPAKYRYERNHGQPPKADFDFGKAAHKRVLGVGEDVVLVDAGDYKTKAAQEARDQAYAEGKVPILPKEDAVIDEMVKALRGHPIASALLDPARGGKPEQSAFWTDADTGVDCRARFDWLPALDRRGRLIVPDYKTARSADLASIGRSLDEYGYARQAAWYLDAVAALGLAESAAFVFVVQEKTAPYLVSVVDIDATSLAAGRFYNQQARRLFAECTASDTWPGYVPDGEVGTASLPGWALNRYFEESGQ
jgi:hypothetical protein